jgi:hypothetical protein
MFVNLVVNQCCGSGGSGRLGPPPGGNKKWAYFQTDFLNMTFGLTISCWKKAGTKFIKSRIRTILKGGNGSGQKSSGIRKNCIEALVEHAKCYRKKSY